MTTVTHEAVKHLCNCVFRAASILQTVRSQNTAEVDDFTRGSKVNGAETRVSFSSEAHLAKT